MKTPSPDISDLKKYPKVELHRHLEGALRFSTLLELAKSSGCSLPDELAQQKSQFLITEPMKDLAAVLNKFWTTQSFISSEEILTRITFESIEDAYNEGIRILELRYAPTFIRKNHEHLSFEKIHQAILRGIKMAEHLPVAVGLICIFQRTLPLQELEKVLSFVIDSKNTWVGVDLADDEDAYPAMNFVSLFEKAKAAGLNVTIHAGEGNSPLAPQNVIDAINHLGATRIGHGLQIIKNERILKFVSERKIPLEICPTSNWLTNAIADLTRHPIRKLISSGILVTINSDDPGIFDYDLTHEYQLLKDYYHFTANEFEQCNDIAAQASFIPLSQKQKHWPRKIL